MKGIATDADAHRKHTSRYIKCHRKYSLAKHIHTHGKHIKDKLDKSDNIPVSL